MVRPAGWPAVPTFLLADDVEEGIRLPALRVVFSTPPPPLPFLRSGGAAGRREDGVGGRAPPVYSSSRYRLEFVALKLSQVAYGVMPRGRPLPRPASAGRRWVVVVQLLVELQWMETTGGGATPASPLPLNKLAGDPNQAICPGVDRHGGGQAVGMAGSGKPGLFLEASVGEGHRQRRACAAASSGRRGYFARLLALFVQGVLKMVGGVVDRVHLTLAPAFGAGHCELIAMPRQVQDHKADASNLFAEALGLLLKISMGSRFDCDSKLCNFFPRANDWNLPGTAHIRGVLLVMQLNGNCWENDKFNQVDFGMLLYHIDQTEEFSSETWSCLYACETIRSGNVRRVQYSFIMISGTLFYLPDDHLVEDAVLLPFGLCHQRCTTSPLLLIPRFNGGDPFRLSSVMVSQNLQLNPSHPRVHTPDRPSGEPPAGHQLVWSTIEALEDCRCSNIGSVLSTDERSLFGFIGNLWYQLQVFRSSFFYVVRLGTFDPLSTTCSRAMLYYEL